MFERTVRFIAVLFISLFFISLVSAAVPGIIGYQGRVMVDGSPFDGTGYFKFAIVTSTGEILWSNDGTSGTNVEPHVAVPLGVDEGLFSLGLGDTSLANMDSEIDPDVFENPEVYLRVWFSSDGFTFEQLSTDQRILVVGYAMEAAHAEEADQAATSNHANVADTLTGFDFMTLWGLSGNAGTKEGTDFLGTTDNQALELKVNNHRAMRLEPNSSSSNVIGGNGANSVTAGMYGATIGGGGGETIPNQVTAHFGTVSGGRNNTARAVDSVVGGGFSNTASGERSTVSGGQGNTTEDNYGTVAGGFSNTASGDSATVGGGSGNTASGNWGTVAGGQNNTAEGVLSFAAGRRAKALHNGSYVWGDSTNADIESTGENQFVVRANGGTFIHGNMDVSGTADVGNLTVTGTLTADTFKAKDSEHADNADQTTNADHANVADALNGFNPSSKWGLSGNAGTTPGTDFLGTRDNQALDFRVNSQRAMRLEPNNYSPNIIGGNSGNSVTTGMYGATIGGGGQEGQLNQVTANYGTIGGGRNNTAGAVDSVVGGGLANIASGEKSMVSGGMSNTASGNYGTVPGGMQNTAEGILSFAAGRRAKALHNGSFVWGDCTNEDIESTGVNQFVVRANGGTFIHGNMDILGTADIGNLTVTGTLTANTFKAKDSDHADNANYAADADHAKVADSVKGKWPTGWDVITVNLPNLAAGAKPLEMVNINTGVFKMGSPDSDLNALNSEKPQHGVLISKDYYISKYEVTQAQWAEVMSGNPWGISTTPSNFSGDNHPVEQVSWYDCARFCNRLSELDGRTPVYDLTTWAIDYDADGYRMPTEAEWENACRAGTTTWSYWGDSFAEIGDYAWYYSNSSSQTHEAGLKLPNAWGLYDMNGNVYELCNDRYSGTYYTNENRIDPVGPDTGSYRVIRGGSRISNSVICRSANRFFRSPNSGSSDIGFRVVSSRTN